MKTVMDGERRHDKRVTKPAISIVIEGTACVTRNWSLSGFLIQSRGLELIPGQDFIASIAASNGTARTKAIG